MITRLSLVIFGILLPMLLHAQNRLTYVQPKYSDSQKDSLERVISSNADPQKKNEARTALIYIYRKITPQKAIAFGHEALQFVKQDHSPRHEAEILSELGKAYDNNRDGENARKCFENALQIRRGLKDLSYQGILLNFIGQSWFESGYYTNALKYFLQSLDVFKSLNDLERISIVENDLGIVNTYIGNYEVALTYYFSALKLKEGRAPNQSLANTLANIADVYNNLKNYSTAEIYFERAIALVSDLSGKMAIKTKLAGVIAELGRVDDAKSYLHNSLSILSPQKNIALIASVYMSLGKVYLKTKQHDSAFAAFTTAQSLYQSYQSRNGVVEAVNQIGYIYILNGKSEKAIPLLLSVLPLADSLEIKDKLRETNEFLSLAYEKSGNYGMALTYRKFSDELKDSINSGQKIAIITAAQLQYETENKNREIELLTQENNFTKQRRNAWTIVSILFIGLAFFATIAYFQKKKTYQLLQAKNEEIKSKNELLQKTTAELQESIATKDKFFSIISHDLKNPFHTILLISSLFADENEKHTEEDIQKMGKNLNKTATNAYKLLENLLEWSRIQQNKVVNKSSNFSFVELLHSVTETMEPNAKIKNIQLHPVYTDDVELFADRNMIHLILRNLITNAIKFSYPDSKITITYAMENGEFVLKVSDQGVGISEENKQRLFRVDGNISSRGTAEESGTGLGLILCKEMAEMHRGKISVESELQKGSTFTLSIPQTNLG